MILCRGLSWEIIWHMDLYSTDLLPSFPPTSLFMNNFYFSSYIFLGGRLCSHFFSMDLLFSIMLTWFHTYAYKKWLKVVTIRILRLSQWLYSSITESCMYSPLKKTLAINIRNLLLDGNEAKCTRSKEIASLQRYGHLIRKKCTPAKFLMLRNTYDYSQIAQSAKAYIFPPF